MLILAQFLFVLALTKESKYALDISTGKSQSKSCFSSSQVAKIIEVSIVKKILLKSQRCYTCTSYSYF